MKATIALSVIAVFGVATYIFWIKADSSTSEIATVSSEVALENLSPIVDEHDTSSSTTSDEMDGVIDSLSNSEIKDADSNLEPIDVQAYREQRGYYASGSSSIDEMHPYELYDLDTLAQLAETDDGLAQLVLADKLIATDPDRADSLYMQAAINGRTAALVNMASSHLVLVPGSTGYGFPIASETGVITDKFVDVLKYYVAAEDLGDVIATDLLRSHIDESQFGNLPESLIRVCESGLALADQIRKERQLKWGSSQKPNTQIVSFDTPPVVCSK
jgi:hypothetical protein